MRYEKGHKETTQERIVDIASRRFRRDGIDSVGVASLMSDAGLTHGGFYNHFRSKEDLVAKSLARALQTTLKRLESGLATNTVDLETNVRAYLAPRHRDAPDRGCAIAAAAGEIARRSESTRQEISALIERLFGLIEQLLPADMPKEEKERRARAIFALEIGTLQLSRIAVDRKKSQQILQSGIEAALSLARSGNEAEKETTGV